MAYSSVEKPDAMKPVSVAAPKVSSKGSRSGSKMTDKQKAQLKVHMEKMKKGGMSATEMRSHRMKLMGRMRKDPKMTATRAHKAVMK